MPPRKSDPTDPDTLFRADGTTAPVFPRNGTHYDLDELYKLLKCDTLELVRDTSIPNHILLVDENGRCRTPLVYNTQAMNLVGGDVVGNALLCHKSRFR